MRERALAPGELLCGRADPGDHLFVVIEGRLRVSVVSADGRELSMRIVGAGEMVGEIAVFDGGPRTTDMTAIAPTRVSALAAETFFAALDRHPQIARNALKIAVRPAARHDEPARDDRALSHRAAIGAAAAGRAARRRGDARPSHGARARPFADGDRAIAGRHALEGQCRARQARTGGRAAPHQRSPVLRPRPAGAVRRSRTCAPRPRRNAALGGALGIAAVIACLAFDPTETVELMRARALRPAARRRRAGAPCGSARGGARHRPRLARARGAVALAARAHRAADRSRARGGRGRRSASISCSRRPIRNRRRRWRESSPRRPETRARSRLAKGWPTTTRGSPRRSRPAASRWASRWTRRAEAMRRRRRRWCGRRSTSAAMWSGDGGVYPLASLAKVAALGLSSLPGDADGVVRRAPLFAAIGGVLKPGLALETLRLARGGSAYVLEASPARATTGKISVALPPDGMLRLAPAALRRRDHFRGDGASAGRRAEPERRRRVHWRFGPGGRRPARDRRRSADRLGDDPGAGGPANSRRLRAGGDRPSHRLEPGGGARRGAHRAGDLRARAGRLRGGGDRAGGAVPRRAVGGRRRAALRSGGGVRAGAGRLRRGGGGHGRRRRGGARGVCAPVSSAIWRRR